jgi:hypothetical protein
MISLLQQDDNYEGPVYPGDPPEQPLSRVEQASASQTGRWKLVKWAKNKHDVSAAYTPALAKRDAGLAREPEEKAKTLRQTFFPPQSKWRGLLARMEMFFL